MSKAQTIEQAASLRGKTLDTKEVGIIKFSDGFSVNLMGQGNSVGKGIWAETIEDVIHLMRKHLEC
jgi:hypothetical protein